MLMDDSVTLGTEATRKDLIDDDFSDKNNKSSHNINNNETKENDDLSVDSHGSLLLKNSAESELNRMNSASIPADPNPNPGNSKMSKPSSLAPSVVSNNNESFQKDDSEENISVTSSVTSFTRRRNEKREKEMKGTLLLFHWANGERQEKELPYRPVTYSEVQREIAKFFPRCTSLLIIQNPVTGEKIFPPNFKPTDLLVIREILCKPLESRPLKTPMAPPFNVYWEGEKYHDVICRRAMEEQQAADDIWGAGNHNTGNFNGISARNYDSVNVNNKSIGFNHTSPF